MKKILLFTFISYLLTLLQISFLGNISIFGFYINFVFLLAILINFFEKVRSWNGAIIALLGGLFLDIYSNTPIGLHITILGGAALLIKFLILRYVRVPFAKFA